MLTFFISQTKKNLLLLIIYLPIANVLLIMFTQYESRQILDSCEIAHIVVLRILQL